MKRFIVDKILEPMLGKVEIYVIFWARLVFRFRKPAIVAITGSVGKSTTTARIATALPNRARSGDR